MNNITTISWGTFFIILAVLFLLWIVTTRTRFGRTIIRKETPWDIRQWTMLLIIVATTVFILINPLFHLLTAAILAGLYYIFISRDALGRKIRYNPGKADAITSNIDFISKPEQLLALECTPKNFDNQLMELKAIEKCIFSFPMIAPKPLPNIEHIKGIYHIKVELTSKDYLSSLMSYIERSGFEVDFKI